MPIFRSVTVPMQKFTSNFSTSILKIPTDAENAEPVSTLWWLF